MAFANCTIVPERFESIDSIVRRLNKATQKAGTFADIRRHESFTPCAERRRTKAHAARMRLRKHGRHFE